MSTDIFEKFKEWEMPDISGMSGESDNDYNTRYNALRDVCFKLNRWLSQDQESLYNWLNYNDLANKYIQNHHAFINKPEVFMGRTVDVVSNLGTLNGLLSYYDPRSGEIYRIVKILDDNRQAALGFEIRGFKE